MSRHRWPVVIVDGVAHLETSRIPREHLLLCKQRFQPLDPNAVLLDHKATVTCRWCTFL